MDGLTGATRDELREKQNARNRMHDGADVLVAVVAVEVAAGHAPESLLKIIEGYRDDIKSEIDGFMEFDGIMEQLAERQPRGIPSWRSANG